MICSELHHGETPWGPVMTTYLDPLLLPAQLINHSLVLSTAERFGEREKQRGCINLSRLLSAMNSVNQGVRCVCVCVYVCTCGCSLCTCTLTQRNSQKSNLHLSPPRSCHFVFQAFIRMTVTVESPSCLILYSEGPLQPGLQVAAMLCHIISDC